MATTWTYPTSVELLAIEQDMLPRLLEDRPILSRYFPPRNQDAALLKWEQLDNYVGLQQLRGLNGKPNRVKGTGQKEYLMTPGYYGEFRPIDEAELTTRRAFGSLTAPISIEDLVLQAQTHLLQRRLDRLEQICWTLAVTGTYSVPNTEGTITHTDSYSIRQFTAAVPWTTAATATPLADMRRMQLSARGFSVSFGADAEAWTTQVTINNLLLNTNAADLYGRRTAGLGTFNDIRSINQLFLNENLPALNVYERGYYDDNGLFNMYIPDNYIVIFGKRPAGQTIGEYRMVRNANNPNMAPGPYTKVIDNVDREVPRVVEVHDGHNGGPVVYYPSAMLVLYVGP